MTIYLQSIHLQKLSSKIREFTYLFNRANYKKNSKQVIYSFISKEILIEGPR